MEPRVHLLETGLANVISASIDESAAASLKQLAAEKNRRTRAIQTGMPRRIFRVSRCVDERQPGRIGSRAGIAVRIRQRD